MAKNSESDPVGLGPTEALYRALFDASQGHLFSAAVEVGKAFDLLKLGQIPDPPEG